jgi:hypothetical protein
MKLRVPNGLGRAIQAAAARRHCSPPELIRQALLNRIEEEGIYLRDNGLVEELNDQRPR